MDISFPSFIVKSNKFYLYPLYEEFVSKNKQMIKPLIKGSAFITGKQELYISKDDPFPEGYSLNDTWPDF